MSTLRDKVKQLLILKPMLSTQEITAEGIDRKTIADCFKYRNKIGLEPAIEALKDGIGNKRTTVDELLYFADICRVKNIITPYLESIL